MSDPEVQVDFCHYGNSGGRDTKITQILSGLSEAQQKLRGYSLDDILGMLDEFAGRLLDRRSLIHTEYPRSGLPFLANWCRRSHLESLIDDALGNRRYLDGFLPSRHRPNRAYRAFPRGLAVHWMAGNVATVAFLSLVQGMITKNANIVKVASSAHYLLPSLLSCLDEKLSSSVAVIRYDRSDQSAQAALSKAADVRVLWGSDEAVHALQSFPQKPGGRTVSFGNKTSLILIGSVPFEIPAIARRIARDVSVFEQKACASPHTIFLETTDPDLVTQFAQELECAMQEALRAFPKIPPSPEEICRILELRAHYDIDHQGWYSQGTEFSIFHDDHWQLGPAIGNRTLFLRSVDHLERVAELMTPQVQTVGLLAQEEQYETLTSLLGVLGVERFVPLGTMTEYDSPWDGTFLIQDMVRWISRPA